MIDPNGLMMLEGSGERMTIWAIEYKCRRCGEITHSTRCGKKLAQQVFTLLVVSEDTVIDFGNPVSRTDLHCCKDGGQGFADLIGTAEYEE